MHANRQALFAHLTRGGGGGEGTPKLMRGGSALAGRAHRNKLLTLDC